MSPRSTCGSMPWLKRFIASVTRSTLPVRSPWPNRQPSTRSAPAISAQLGGGDRGAAVVVRVQADRGVLAAGQAAPEVLDLVGVGVGRRHLDRGGQVEDDLAAGLGLPHVGDRLADAQREVGVGLGEDLRAVLVAEGLAADEAAEPLLGVLHHHLGAADGDVAALVGGDVEDHALEQRGRGVVEVHGRARGADQRVDGALDQVLTGLRQHRDLYVVGDAVLVDELAHEVEVGLARAGEADLDLLVAHRHQQLEHRELAGGCHRVDERLVAVAQVGGQPARRLLDLPGRPGAVGHVDGHERRVAGERHRARALLVGGVAQVGHEFLGLLLVCEGATGTRHTPQRGGRVRPRCGGEGGEGCAS